MSNSDAHKALTSLVVLVTVVSSFVLVKRLESPVPVEDEHQKNVRGAILYISGIVLALALYKALCVSWPKLAMTKLPVDVLYNGLALVVICLNLYYISTVKKYAHNDVTSVSTQNLVATVLILSAVSLILMLKKGLWKAGKFLPNASDLSA